MSDRQCYVIIPEQRDSKGYIPSLVIENKSGHRPLTSGNHKFAEPYHWGKNLAEAERICKEKNEHDGLSEEDVRGIILSSMK